MDIFGLLLLVAMGIVCAILHKNKGYSPIAGFCWGFFLFIIGLIIVLLEKDKDEVDSEGGLSVKQWIAIFVGIGTVGIIIFLFILSHS